MLERGAIIMILAGDWCLGFLFRKGINKPLISLCSRIITRDLNMPAFRVYVRTACTCVRQVHKMCSEYMHGSLREWHNSLVIPHFLFAGIWRRNVFKNSVRRFHFCFSLTIFFLKAFFSTSLITVTGYRLDKRGSIPCRAFDTSSMFLCKRRKHITFLNTVIYI